MPEKRTPGVVHIADALKEYMKRSGTERRVQAQQVITEWEEAVGPALARSATPQKIVNGVLTIKARDSVWRTELLMRRTEIAQKINAYFRVDLVTTIVVK